MTKTDFFRIVIKLFGVYVSIFLLFSFIPSNLFSILLYNSFEPFLYSIISVCLVIGLMWVLIFKTDSIIKVLKLNQGFDDENIELGNLNTESIIKIGLIIIGGFLIIDSFPTFITNTFYSFKNSIKSNTLDQLLETFNPYKVDYFSWITSGLKIILGYLMLTNMKRITSWLNKNDTKKVGNTNYIQ